MTIAWTTEHIIKLIPIINDLTLWYLIFSDNETPDTNIKKYVVKSTASNMGFNNGNDIVSTLS